MTFLIRFFGNHQLFKDKFAHFLCGSWPSIFPRPEEKTKDSVNSLSDQPENLLRGLEDIISLAKASTFTFGPIDQLLQEICRAKVLDDDDRISAGAAVVLALCSIGTTA